MKFVPVKFKMTSGQFQMLYNDYLENNSKPDTPYFMSFSDYLDYKFGYLVDKNIDEVISNANTKN